MRDVTQLSELIASRGCAGRDRRRGRRGRAPAAGRRCSATHGRLMMIAADHPARGALRAGDRPLAMADRADLLDRLCARALPARA